MQNELVSSQGKSSFLNATPSSLSENIRLYEFNDDDNDDEENDAKIFVGAKNFRQHQNFSATRK